MKFTDRAIKEAFDKISGRVIEANQVFKRMKDGFITRKEYHFGEVDLYCRECNQSLVVAVSKLDNPYFRHHPNSEYCALKDETLSEEITSGYLEVLKGRESDRHKYLKNLIGKGLTNIDGIEKDSIIIDTHFIKRGSERRRPDVYCKYQGKEIVFEIQLSKLSLKYINHRFNFYKKHGIYLFWILDFTHEHVKSQMERDIKYLSSHQNLFGVDETTTELKLICRYKSPYIFEEKEIREKWLQKSVALGQLTFREKTIEPVYFDYEGENYKILKRLELITQKAQEEEELRKEKEQERESLGKINWLIEKVKENKRLDYNFYQLYRQFDSLTYKETELLNKLLNFTGIYKDKPLINYYIGSYRHSTDKFKMSFIEFLLTQYKIRFDVNLKSEDGKGCLQELYENQDLSDKRYRLLPTLFIRGYKVTQFDLNYFSLEKNCPEDNSEVTLLKLKYLDEISNKKHAALVTEHFRYLLFIESAIKKKIISSGLKSWVAYLVTIQGGYKKFWKFTKEVLVKTGTWDIVIKGDKKGTIERKVIEFNLENLEPDFSIAPILNELFPTIYKANF